MDCRLNWFVDQINTFTECLLLCWGSENPKKHKINGVTLKKVSKFLSSSEAPCQTPINPSISTPLLSEALFAYARQRCLGRIMSFIDVYFKYLFTCLPASPGLKLQGSDRSILWRLNYSVECCPLRKYTNHSKYLLKFCLYFPFLERKMWKETFRILYRINDHHISTLIGHCLCHPPNPLTEKQSFMIHI